MIKRWAHFQHGDTPNGRIVGNTFYSEYDAKRALPDVPHYDPKGLRENWSYRDKFESDCKLSMAQNMIEIVEVEISLKEPKA